MIKERPRPEPIRTPRPRRDDDHNLWDPAAAFLPAAKPKPRAVSGHAPNKQYEGQRSKAGSSCYLEADAHD
jgi:hypothetical protein